MKHLMDPEDFNREMDRVGKGPTKDEKGPLRWCTCDDGRSAHFVKDTPEMKHHWLCASCGNVTQIG